MATVSLAAAERLIPDIYEAALQPKMWPGVVAGLCQVLGAAGGELVNAGILLSQGWVIHDFPEHVIQRYVDKYAATDTVLPAVMSRAAQAPIVLDFASDRRVLAAPFFSEVVEPSGIKSFCVAGLGSHSGAGFEFVAFIRPERRKPFDQATVDLLGHLTPHLRSAGIVQMRMEAETAPYAGALNAMTSPVILLDRSGRIVFANRAAEALLRANDGLSCNKGALLATTPNGAAAWSSALADATGSVAERTLAPGREISIGRPSGKAPLLVHVAPLGRGNSHGSPAMRAAVGVFIHDPEHHPRSSGDRLRAVFGLTGAEARVALALADGLSPAEIAERQGCSPKTVRTQMEAFFAKLGVRRQAQAVRSILATAAAFAPPGKPE